MRAIFLPIFLIFALALCPVFVHAQEQPVWKKDGVWADLYPYAGTTDYEGLLKDKRVKAALEKILKGHEIDMTEQFDVHSGIGLDNDCLILRGGIAGKADTNRAYMEVCLNQGNVDLAIYTNGDITIYSNASDYQYMSEELHQWVYLQSGKQDYLITKPDNVSFAAMAKD